MRDIKFRGLTTSGEWVYGSLVVTTDFLKNKKSQHTKTWIIESSFGNGGWFSVKKRHYVKPETVGQFTGVTDSQGIDIYEGDIVDTMDDGFKAVGFDSLNAMFVLLGWSALHYYIDSGFLVRGNIHQNPELLEDNQ